MSDHALLHDALRRSTAQMLHYNLANLSPVEALRLDTAIALRLELDRSAAAQARGEAVDVRALTAAAEALERLLHPAETVSQAKPHSAAIERLRALIDATILAGPDPDAPSRAELEAEIERLRAELAARDSTPAPAVTVPSADNIVPLRSVPAPTQQQPAPVSVKAPPPPSSEAEWLRWYRAGGGGGSNFGIHNIPRDF